MDERVIEAVLTVYTEHGAALWLRKWLDHPDEREQMERNVLNIHSMPPLPA